MPHRNFFKKSREEGLAEEAAQLRAIAGMLPPGAVRDATLRCARGPKLACAWMIGSNRPD